MIFVSLVAYCDKEVEATINSIFENAHKPKEIVVGLVNQDDEPFEYKGKHKVKVINILPEKSKGYSHCRLLCNTNLYNKEKFYFQCDPHSRLIKDWDKKLLNYYNSQTGKRIIVSTPSAYDLDGKRYFKYSVTGAKDFNKFSVVQGVQQQDKNNIPFKNGIYETTLFLAGCVFAPKEWLKDVAYDTSIFLWGEEIDISLRTFGEGYKACLLQEEIIWHLWGHQNRKHLGYIREKAFFDKKNNAGKKYVFKKLLKRKYKRQDEFFEINGLSYEKLQSTYESWLFDIKDKEARACARKIANFTRNYSTAFKTKADNVYDVPQVFLNKYQSHFRNVI